jgi:N-ethylmaleimide reductase
MNVLLEPVSVGKLTLPNRLVMSPMTRNRAVSGGRVTGLHAEYYSQRASAGLIIAESTQPNVIGQGYFQTPGIHDREQVEAWKPVTRAVHDAGGRIFVQLTHCGRIGHPVLYPDGALPLAPSPVPSGEQLPGADGMLDHPTPRPMTAADITATIGDFAAAAANSIDAGFDGVEIHGGNGFLLHQFLADNANLRDDDYGGSTVNRIRFTVEVVEAVAQAIGAERTGLKVSPGNPYNGILESDPATVYQALVKALAPTPLAYIHLFEGGDRSLTRILRDAWPGTLILNPHLTAEAFPATPQTGADAIADGVADAVSMATLWLANPDLPARIRAGGPYNEADPSTFYGGDHRGYTDYPALDQAHAPQTQLT